MISTWNETTLGAIASPDHGLVDGPFGSDLPAASYTATGVPVVRGSNLSVGTRRFSEEGFVYVTAKTAARLKRSLCRPNDIIFTKKGTLGQTGIIPAQSVFKEFLLSSNQMKLTVDPLVAEPLYVYYWVCSPASRAKIIRDSETTGVPKTNLAYLREFPILLPALPEQRSIARCLGALDDKIELNRQMNEALEAMARAVFKAWFIDFEPVKAKSTGATSFRSMPQDAFDLLPDQLTESELGPIPGGWRVEPLSELVELLGGGTPKRKMSEYWGGSIPWFSVRDAPADGDVWGIDTEEYITEAGVDNSSAVVVRAGTTIISARGTVGRLALTAVPMAMNQSCYGVQGKNGVGDFFAYYMLHHAVEELRQRTHGSVFDTITRQTFEVLSRVHPGPEILRTYEDAVAPYLHLMRNNLFENGTLARIRDTLLPRLMSGKIRVPRVEEVLDGR